MSKLKTCVVMGTFTLGNNEGNFNESAVFGKGQKYETAHDFIKFMKVDYLGKVTNSYVITNIIIG